MYSLYCTIHWISLWICFWSRVELLYSFPDAISFLLLCVDVLRACDKGTFILGSILFLGMHVMASGLRYHCVLSLSLSLFLSPANFTSGRNLPFSPRPLTQSWLQWKTQTDTCIDSRERTFRVLYLDVGEWVCVCVCVCVWKDADVFAFLGSSRLCRICLEWRVGNSR